MDAHEKQELLRIARKAIEHAAAGLPLDAIDTDQLPKSLQANGACFVTLTVEGGLRGCIGSLEAIRPLVADVQEHAVDAAVNDFRFPPVSPEEVGRLRIELSVLSPSEPLDYSGPEELPRRLRPGVDGVVLQRGSRRATFLPQVWEKVPDPEEFLGLLCEKMGLPAESWRREKMKVAIYQVESFEEEARS
jgi:uncharacterized protein